MLGEYSAVEMEPKSLRENFNFRRWLAIAGPGLVVMLADTDAGCLITAGQSGATWGYTLIPLQLVLIPVVFMAQELTVRLGIFTGQGQCELIWSHFGRVWGAVAGLTILITCTGGLVSEISGVVAIGELAGVPKWVSVLLADVTLFLIVATGRYRQVEKIAIGIGLFELVFVLTMFMAAPSPLSVYREMFHMPSSQESHDEYLFLIAANIGAVVMPWMMFYQQSAVVDKKLTIQDLEYSRLDTAVGACLTQLIMIGALVTTAATVWDGKLPSSKTLETIGDFSNAVTAHLGPVTGRILFSLGILGGSMIGAIVISLTAAWSLGELMGFKRSLEHSPKDAPWFYGVYAGVLAIGSVICLSPINIIALNILIQVLNALLLPLVLGFIFVLASNALPKEHALSGTYRYFVGATFFVCSATSIYAAVKGLRSA